MTAVKKKRPMGRPTKLTTARQASIVDLLKRGNYLETAATASGIDRATLRSWIKRGKDAKRGPYRNFYRAVREAMTFAEIMDVDTIRKAADTDWRAAAWRLEHRYPQRFKRTPKQKHEVTGSGGGPVSSAVIYLPDNGRLPKKGD